MGWYLFRFLMIFTIPAVAIPPPAPVADIMVIEDFDTLLEIQPPVFNYDDILILLEAIEKEEIEAYCTPEQLEKIAEFVSMLAEKGAIPDDHISFALLQQDIRTLLNDTHSTQPFAFANNEDFYFIKTAPYSHESNILLCKKRSWFGEKCHNIGKFVKKHKKEIIIGAIVVVAAVVVTVAAVSIASVVIASSATATAGAATSAVINEKNEPPPSQSLVAAPESSPSAIQKSETPENHEKTSSFAEPFQVAQIIEDKTAYIKTAVLEELFQNCPINADPITDISLIEKARDVGSWITHKVLDTVANLVEPVPEFLAQTKNIGLKLLPSSPDTDNHSDLFSSVDPLEMHKERVSVLHQKIDEAFNTEYAYQYTEEYKTGTPENIFAIGILPPPSFFNGIFGDTRALSAAGTAFDRGGFTKAGRGLMKHGYREGSAFPKPLGNPTQVNEHGKKVLDMILNHPERQFIQGEYKRYGKVVDIVVPGVGGVRYDIQGIFIGFLEP